MTAEALLSFTVFLCVFSVRPSRSLLQLFARDQEVAFLGVNVVCVTHGGCTDPDF